MLLSQLIAITVDRWPGREKGGWGHIICNVINQSISISGTYPAIEIGD